MSYHDDVDGFREMLESLLPDARLATAFFRSNATSDAHVAAAVDLLRDALAAPGAEVDRAEAFLRGVLPYAVAPDLALAELGL